MDTTLSRNAADLQRDGKFAALAPETLTNAEELLAKLAQGAAATTTNRPAAEADFTAGPRLAASTPDTAPLPDLTPLPNVVPPPDIALHDMAPRPLGHAQATGKRKSRGRRAVSGLFRLLLAACIGVVATLAWQSYGAAGRRTIASLIAKPGLSSSPDMTQPLPGATPLSTTPGAANQDPAGAVEANAADSAPAPVAKTTPHPAVTSAPAAADVSGQIEALAQDITAMRQSLEQLTAAQSEMARSIAALPAAEDARREQPASAPSASAQPASAPPASAQPAAVPPAAAPRRPTAARKPTPPPPQRASQPLAPGPRPLSQSVATTPPPPPPPATSPAASTPRASAPAPLSAEPPPPRPPGSMP